MRIGFIGRKYSGKGVASAYVLEKYHFDNMYAFATPIKEISKAMFSFNDRQLYGDLKETVDPYWNITPRIVFQTLGDYLRTNPFNIPTVTDDFFVAVVERNCCGKNVVIEDVRQENEVLSIIKAGGTIIGLVRDVQLNEFSNHPTETEVDRLMKQYAHYTIDNNGTIDDLHGHIDNIMDRIIC